MREDTTRRILLVEDDQALRDLVATHLRKRGFEVQAVESGETVLRAIRDHTLAFDLALVDVHLPGMSGVTLSRLLLATQPLNPVMVITGDHDESLARDALGLGVTGYLLKPFELYELDAAVSQAVAMTDLVEATETLARAQSQGLDDWGEAGGSLPRSWLHLGDERSGAGAGHGSRVVSIAGLLAKSLPDEALNGLDRERLRTAARTHEIGRLIGVGEGVARRSAQLLQDLGFDGAVCEVVRQAAEPWSPGLPLSARIVGLADRLDHAAVERASAGAESDEAIREAIDGMIRGAGDTADPELVSKLSAERERVESMWVLQRQVAAA